MANISELIRERRAALRDFKKTLRESLNANLKIIRKIDSYLTRSRLVPEAAEFQTLNTLLGAVNKELDEAIAKSREIAKLFTI
jgi:hypothetical protein